MDAKTPQISPNVPARSGFHSPAEYLSDLSSERLGQLINAASDIALVLENGVVKDVSLASRALVSSGYNEAWLGKPWIDTVTIESRPKIEALLNESDCFPRQVNHMSQSALDFPVRYTTVKLSGGDRVLAFGQDLSEISILQQKLVGAHQELERDYSRMRQAEGRYRLLFNSSSEAILIVNGDEWTIEEANTAAENLTERTQRKLIKTSVTSLFDPSAAGRINTMIATAATQGMATELAVHLNGGKQVDLSASAFLDSDAKRIILRLIVQAPETNKLNVTRSFDKMIDHLPDGLVIADADQRILYTNETFVQAANLSSSQDAKGQPLHTYLGRSATDVNVLYSSLKKNGLVRNFATLMKDRYGSEESVEVSAVSAPHSDRRVFAFSVRGVSRRLTQSPGLNEKLPSAASDFTELVGRVPLKDIVSESTVLIERLCIEAALKISNNNRAAAADMLGLSRQGLYSKLKRVGLETGDER
ncbi:MAG: transcriptional regulator PpsR [Pseudomonadota bacterium]